LEAFRARLNQGRLSAPRSHQSIEGRSPTTCAVISTSAVAELPQFLDRTRILVQDPVGSKRVELTSTEAIDPSAHMLDELNQTSPVIRRHGLTRRLPLRLR
jgi:hypothetical protein